MNRRGCCIMELLTIIIYNCINIINFKQSAEYF